MAKINICEISDIFQGKAVDKHPFPNRDMADLVKLGYRFGCLVTYLPEAQKDCKLIAEMRGILSEMLDIADANTDKNAKIILPLAHDNPISGFIRDVVLKYMPKNRFGFMRGEYHMHYDDMRGEKENVLREGLRGIIPARKAVPA